MPQLDFTTYSSQLFWFSICFAVLYIFVSKIILPRITRIIEERQNIVTSNTSAANALNTKLEEIEAKTKLLRKEAGQQYQIKLEEEAKKSLSQRTEAIKDLKEKIDESTKKSRQEIKDFVAKTTASNESTIKDLTNNINEKLFGKDLAQTLNKS